MLPFYKNTFRLSSLLDFHFLSNPVLSFPFFDFCRRNIFESKEIFLDGIYANKINKAESFVIATFRLPSQIDLRLLLSRQFPLGVILLHASRSLDISIARLKIYIYIYFDENSTCLPKIAFPKQRSRGAPSSTGIIRGNASRYTCVLSAEFSIDVAN